MRVDKASDKRLVFANFAIFPTLAAKFLPLKMLTVLSFLIFPYSIPYTGFLRDTVRVNVPVVFVMLD